MTLDLRHEIKVHRELKKAVAQVMAAYESGLRPPQLVHLARKLYYQAHQGRQRS